MRGTKKTQSMKGTNFLSDMSAHTFHEEHHLRFSIHDLVCEAGALKARIQTSALGPPSIFRPYHVDINFASHLRLTWKRLDAIQA